MCSDSHKEFGKFTPLGGKFYLQSTMYRGSWCSFKEEPVEGRILHNQGHTQQEAAAHPHLDLGGQVVRPSYGSFHRREHRAEREDINICQMWKLLGSMEQKMELLGFAAANFYWVRKTKAKYTTPIWVPHKIESKTIKPKHWLSCLPHEPPNRYSRKISPPEQ